MIHAEGEKITAAAAASLNSNRATTAKAAIEIQVFNK